ncbi:hypothetical protein DV515_00006997 [Chloebia gouldiae]|uniref:Uncharacterized protein n=1 Tax=Chloebia gouldiae TaxID=44316 RepID=A0A3L8SK51_CHLGU|nr:hypothetical protein DV515_00006997 [Chloebia gouldiae]
MGHNFSEVKPVMPHQKGIWSNLSYSRKINPSEIGSKPLTTLKTGTEDHQRERKEVVRLTS